MQKLNTEENDVAAHEDSALLVLFVRLIPVHLCRNPDVALSKYLYCSFVTVRV